MYSIRLKTTYIADSLPIGSSKSFGNPDVWEGFEWPAIEEDGELYDLTFMCQINCAEIAAFDKDGKLPKTGMLYFFYDLDEMPSTPSAEQAAKVLYYNGNIDSLRQIKLVDEDGEDLSVKEMKLDFEIVDDGYLDDADATHLILGTPSLDYGTDYDMIDDWQMLLQIDSMETDEVVINFTDEGVLCFFIDPKKLENRDFSDVRIVQIYS
jgi:uncharacterized protein YwqG